MHSFAYSASRLISTLLKGVGAWPSVSKAMWSLRQIYQCATSPGKLSGLAPTRIISTWTGFLSQSASARA
jgi:hypothetical protein